MGAGILDGTYCAGISARVLEACPALVQLVGRIAQNPRVSEWNARTL